MWRNIRQQYKNNELKITTSKWNDELKLLDGFIQCQIIHNYIKHIIKNFETLTTNPPIPIYITRINFKVVFKMKDRF